MTAGRQANASHLKVVIGDHLSLVGWVNFPFTGGHGHDGGVDVFMTRRKCLIFSFADVEVRERELSIVRKGESLAVEPKAFRVLLVLLTNPHNTITKDKVLDAVWKETSVSENSLTRSIALLRRLLADDPFDPRYIATVPTVGYRFLCDVKITEDGFIG